ncbi:amine oxidase, partial [Thelephora terrestris]
KHATVLILGGGVAGVIAAKTLAEQGVKDFKIIEARGELGGRLHSETFGEPGRQATVELGANWVQGTGGGPGQGPENPIWALVQKYGIQTRENSYYDDIAMFDQDGPANYTDLFDAYEEAYSNLTIAAGARVDLNLVDTTARTGYSIIDVKPRTPHEMAVEYYNFDWEYAQTPEQSSWIASSWGNNYTYDVDSGGFSADNQLSIDPRGFKTFIQDEAESFLDPDQVLLNSVVKTISYSGEGVTVTLVDETRLEADYALVSFSLGVLQHEDVTWEPELPPWKTEAIQSMTMATYTKIFMQFPKKFWFDAEIAIYADRIRGRYPVWQSLDHENFFPGSGILFATVTGDWSERIEALTDAEVQVELMDVLHAMYPNITDMPQPTSILFHRWYNDPLARGSYSNWPASFFQEHHDNLRATVSDRLWFTGEHCSQKYFGFLHGAWFEGRDAGQELTQCIKGGGCASIREHFEVVKNALPYKV